MSHLTLKGKSNSWLIILLLTPRIEHLTSSFSYTRNVPQNSTNMKPMPQGVSALYNTTTEHMVTLAMSLCIVLSAPSSIVPSFQNEVYQVENAFTQLETYSVAVADFVIEK
jgi:hypothetical protein